MWYVIWSRWKPKIWQSWHRFVWLICRWIDWCSGWLVDVHTMHLRINEKMDFNLWLIGWLIGHFCGCSVDWLIGYLIVWLINWLVDWLIDDCVEFFFHPKSARYWLYETPMSWTWEWIILWCLLLEPKTWGDMWYEIRRQRGSFQNKHGGLV